MLYLEDYLEMIEHLPIELRDRFTEMREIDLGVENTVDRSVINSSAGHRIMIQFKILNSCMCISLSPGSLVAPRKKLFIFLK